MKVVKFVDLLSNELKQTGRFRMCSAYHSTLNSVSEFCRMDSLTIKELYTKDFLHRYEEYLIRMGLKRNTISFYMTILKMIYSAAVKMGKLPFQPNLFADVFTGSDPTCKRAVSPEVIARIHHADLSLKPHLDRCRDLFMLSFHLQGMSFVDMAYLRKNDVQNDLIVYRRHKTKGVVTVAMLEPAKEILDKYADEVADLPYVLPIVTLTGLDGNRQYQSALRKHNRQLKSLAEYLGIEDNLTSYVARHSWATIAYHNGVEVSLVSQAMGHHTEEITRVYLSSFEHRRLVEVNRIVLKAILRPIEEGWFNKETSSVEMQNSQGGKITPSFPEKRMNEAANDRITGKKNWIKVIGLMET